MEHYPPRPHSGGQGFEYPIFTDLDPAVGRMILKNYPHRFMPSFRDASNISGSTFPRLAALAIIPLQAFALK